MCEGETYVVAALGLVLYGNFAGVPKHLFAGVALRAIALEGMRISLGAGLPVMIECIMNMNAHSDPHPACLEEFSISERRGAGIRKW